MPSPIMLVGEGPGQHEAAQGVPFVGASGTDLEYVFLKRAAKLRRRDIYITNVVKWRTDENDRDPTLDEILRDEPELLTEIQFCDPKIIVAVGKIAIQWFMSSGDDFARWVAEVRDEDGIDMEKLHGVPIRCPRFPNITLLPVYHPAAGLHAADRYYDKIYWDFQQLGRLVRGEIGPLDFDNNRHYSDVDPAVDLALQNPTLLAMDTEGSVKQPWGLSLSVEEGRALVLRGVTDSPAKDTIRKVLQQGVRVVGHNILHDLDVLGALNVPVSLDRCEDTMLMAYLLPWLPRRLKALSYKLFRMEQDEYQEIIAPAEAQICQAYLQKVLDNRCLFCGGSGERQVPYKRNINKFRTAKCEDCGGDGTNWPAPVPELVFGDDGSSRLTRPTSVGRRVRALLERGAGLREGWANIDGAVRTHVEDHLGPLREATLDDIPLEKAVHYSAADADATLRVYNRLEPVLKKEGLWSVYEIDKGILPIIHRMHINGIRINRGHFARLHTEFTAEQHTSINRISNLAGKPINPASPLQTAELIYDLLGCRALRGKRSTDEKTLETLKIKYKSNPLISESVDQITNYRELAKLVGTYVEPLPRAADSFDRVHTRFLLHVVATGRLSSRDPNLQNIPTRTERGRSIRAGFIPRDGCRLVSVDLDQIELRVAAHLSEDEKMIEVFRSGVDIHRQTAALIYNKRPEDITALERLLAKTINFLILYGGGANRLNTELNLLGITTTKDQCIGYINGWFGAYPGVRDYIERCHRQAEAVGYVECLFGRRRYVQGVHSCVDRVREESLKWATNFPVQATAASILKIWMRRVWDNVIPVMARQGYCEPLLTIHDELILEAEEGMQDELISRLVSEAAQAVELLVPIKAKGISAYDWSGLKD